MGKSLVATPATLGMLFALAFAWSMQSAWRATFGPFLNWLGDLGLSFGTRLGHVAIHPFGFAHTINTNVQKFLSASVAMAEKSFVRLLNIVVEPYLLIVGVTLALGLTAYEGFEALWHAVTHTAPSVARDTLWRPTVRAIQHSLQSIDARIRSLAHQMQALAAHVAHIAASIPHAIPQVIPRLGRLEKTAVDYTRLYKWMKRNATKILVGGALATALARIGLGWIRCRNMSRVGKRVCGVNPSWIDEFLAGTLLIVGANSFEEFVKEAQAGYDLGIEGLQLFIREFRDLDIPKG